VTTLRHETARREETSARAIVVWVVAVVALTAGGAVAWLSVDLWLCEDVQSPGADWFCNRGGSERTLAILGACLVAAIVVPALGALWRRRYLFWAGIIVPTVVAVIDLLLVVVFGRK
jgi:hypothetical protein